MVNINSQQFDIEGALLNLPDDDPFTDPEVITEGENTTNDGSFPPEDADEIYFADDDDCDPGSGAEDKNAEVEAEHAWVGIRSILEKSNLHYTDIWAVALHLRTLVGIHAGKPGSVYDEPETIIQVLDRLKYLKVPGALDAVTIGQDLVPRCGVDMSDLREMVEQWCVRESIARNRFAFAL